jgi:hypothetical protein
MKGPHDHARSPLGPIGVRTAGPAIGPQPVLPDHGTAAFWLGGQLFGFTRREEGELVLTIEACDDGCAVSVNEHSLDNALAEAKRLLESH